MTSTSDLVPDFEHALPKLPDGTMEGVFQGRRWGATIQRSADRRRIWLFAEKRGGTDIVSFNLYVLSDGKVLLKPCEMSFGKAIAFVVGFEISSNCDSGTSRVNTTPVAS
jgi:hypothetical protein